jgi:hypothetical protein
MFRIIYLITFDHHDERNALLFFKVRDQRSSLKHLLLEKLWRQDGD